MIDIQRRLEAAGFTTVQEDEEYVICTLDLAALVSEADRCAALLGPDYVVQASYSPGTDGGSLFVSHKDAFCDCGEEHIAPLAN